MELLHTVVTLELVLAWYEGDTPARMNSSERLLGRTKKKKKKKKNVYGDSFGTTEDAVPHWPRLDVCRPRRGGTLNSRRLLCWRFTGGKIRRPSLWSKGMVSGSVLFSGRRGCVDQADDVVFLPLPPCCGMQAHKYTGAKRGTFLILYWSASAPWHKTTKIIKPQFRI